MGEGVAVNLRRPLIFVLALCAVLLVAAGAQGASVTRHTPTTKYPPLLDMFNVNYVKTLKNGTLWFSVVLSYNGLMWPTYPQLKPNDSIPTVRTRLNVPSGVRIVKTKFTMAPPNNGKYYKRYPAKDFRWKMVKGHPTWVFHSLRSVPLPEWRFYVRTSDASKPVCISASVDFPGLRQAPKQKSAVTCSPQPAG